MKRPLSFRELQLAQLSAAGLTDQQIARVEGIARGTVTTLINRVFWKLDVNARPELAAALESYYVGSFPKKSVPSYSSRQQDQTP